ncbi:hypothetical protein JQC92_17730 [Shewanella sp. 202IG2-18]|uniref:hypothetical protein n=1 Tax=Parashewanella hymeniacidonis TaxID=2807618 RepID=UPI00196135B4|nr:hypothetical protein [Parashewanella hymeniacidonis]MBM7073851.1 hypothetical protein [Parashewanella hymeniacidonis]
MIDQVDAALRLGHRFNLCLFFPIIEEQTQELLAMIRLCNIRGIPIVVFTKRGEVNTNGVSISASVKEVLSEVGAKLIELQQHSVFSEQQFHDKLNGENIDILIFAGCNYTEKARASIVGRSRSASGSLGKEFGASDHQVQIFTSPSLLREPNSEPDENQFYLTCRNVSNFPPTIAQSNRQTDVSSNDEVEQRRFFRALDDNNFAELMVFQKNKPKLVANCFYDSMRKNDVIAIAKFLKFPNAINVEKLYETLNEYGSRKLLTAALKMQNIEVVNWILSSRFAAETILKLQPKNTKFEREYAIRALVHEMRELKVDILKIRINGTNLIEYCVDKECWETLDNIVTHYWDNSAANYLLCQRLFRDEKVNIPPNKFCGAINAVAYLAFLHFQKGDEKPLLNLLKNVIPLDSVVARTLCEFYGYQLIELGIKHNNEEIVNWVTNVNWKKASLIKVDKSGNSLLHHAVKEERTCIALTLIHYCDLNKRNNDGKRPLDDVKHNSDLWQFLEHSEKAGRYLIKPSQLIPHQPIEPPPSQVHQYARYGPHVSEPRPHHLHSFPKPPPMPTPQKLATEADIGDRSFFLDKEKYQSFLKQNGFVDGITKTEYLFEAAVEQNNYAALAYICTEIQKFQDLPVEKYDNLTYLLIQDDEGRLRRNFPHMSKSKGAYFVTLGKNISGKYGRIEPIRIGKKPFTDNSKLIINGHGPQIAGMTGSEFGKVIERWLISVGCKGKVCPKITLVSCNVGQDQAEFNPDNGLIEFKDSFVTDLVDYLGKKGRNIRVTATSGVVSTMGDGVEICFMENPETKEVFKWQGEGCWLSPLYPYRRLRGFDKLSKRNYDASMVKLYEFDSITGKVTSRNKYEGENEHFGLQSVAVHEAGQRRFD